MHPSTDALSDHAYELLEDAEIDRHLRECAPCAQLVWRYRCERARVEKALEEPLPAGIRIPTLRRRPWSAAAAVLLAGLAVALAARLKSAEDRSTELEHRLAMEREMETRSFQEALTQLCLDEIDRALDEIGTAQPAIHDALAAAAARPAEVFERYLRGEIDAALLAETDLLAVLDRDLRSALSEEEYSRAEEILRRERGRAAEALAEQTAADLERELGLDAAQRRTVRDVVSQKISWRNDLPLLPPFLREVIGRSALEGHQQIVAALSPRQVDRFHGYLKTRRDELERQKIWLREKYGIGS